MTNIWLPMSAGKSHISKKYIDSHATQDPTVFIVGPEGGPTCENTRCTHS